MKSKKSISWKKIIPKIIFLGIAISILIISFIFYNLQQEPILYGEEILFTISQGQSVSFIASELEKLKLVNNQQKFVNYLIKSEQDKIIQIGEFILQKGMSFRQIAEIITSREAAKKYRLTIIEGQTSRDISETLERIGLMDKETFLAIDPGQFNLPQLKESLDNLEGFLFPDTYIIPRKSPEQVISMLLSNFSQKVNDLWESSEVVKEIGFYNTVILASIVEKEARVDSERPIVASVFYNRLRIGMLLQSCATVNYLFPEPKEVLTFEDLATPSPFNTYLHRGLPPTPISNPGLSSLKAAFFPANTEYLYFVHKGDGTHEFSKTLEAHNQAKRKYLRP